MTKEKDHLSTHHFFHVVAFFNAVGLHAFPPWCVGLKRAPQLVTARDVPTVRQGASGPFVDEEDALVRSQTILLPAGFCGTALASTRPAVPPVAPLGGH